jgi:DNA-directed RNA polymerase specialized sigma24 family protein
VRQEQTEFAEFFESSWDPCLRAVLAVAGSPQQAEDQVAEAFARAWRAWRRVSRHPAPRALRSLPPRQREVIALRVFLDMDTGEIAAQLGIAPATVRVHLARATAALRRELSPARTQEVDQ